MGWPDFRQSFNEIAGKHGWAYKGNERWRSKIVYSTNVTRAFNAGRYKQMLAVKDVRPFWQYRHTPSEHPRLMHLAWDGLILPADDPWFDTHMPQNGWNCKCRVYSLSRTEAARAWSAKGQDGPDSAPPIEWEQKTVGGTSSMPRTVLTPKGIDPGFAYNPGKAWLEPHTVPPLDGYDKSLDKRKVFWPGGSSPPAALPGGTPISSGLIYPPTIPPIDAVSSFLAKFKATLDHGVHFEDKAGSILAISKALFIKGNDKSGDNFKWLSAPDKVDRLRYINLLADTILDPDEIWWAWEESRAEPGRWLLRRRLLKIFQVEGRNEYAITSFDWSREGWDGSTVFMVDRPSAESRLAYFNLQRVGRLIWKK